MRPITSPGMARNSTPSTAVRPPNWTVRCSVASTDPSPLSDAGSEREVAVERRRRRGDRLGRVDRSQALVDPAEQRVAHVVPDLHEPAGDVEQDDEQADARREQRHQLVARARTTGSPITHTAPDDRAREAAEAADHDDGDQPQRVVDQEEAAASAGPNVRFTAPRSTPPRPAMNPPDRERDAASPAPATPSWRRWRARSRALRRSCDRCRCASGARRAPSTRTSTNKHEVVVRAVAVGELERTEVRAWDLDRGAAGGEDGTAEDVGLRRDRERQRADREQQPADAQAPRCRRSPRRDWRRPRRAGAPTGRRCSGARRRGTGCRATRC